MIADLDLATLLCRSYKKVMDVAKWYGACRKCQPPLSFYAAAAAPSLQSGPTLCDPTDGSPPGSPVPGILQAGTLEWVAISFSNA